MRMTVAIKDDIQTSIMRDLPPAPDKQPAIDAALLDAVARLPEAIRKLWNDETTRNFITTQTVWSASGNVAVTVPASRDQLNTDILSQAAIDKLNEAGEAIVNHNNHRRELNKKIRKYLDSCSTVNVFCTRFPELAKYAPKEAPTPNLPATTELVDNLKAAGLKIGENA